VFSFALIKEPDDGALEQQEAVNNQVLDKLESLIKTEINETGVTEEEAAIAAIEDLVDYLEGLDSVADVTRGDSAVCLYSTPCLYNVQRTQEETNEKTVTQYLLFNSVHMWLGSGGNSKRFSGYGHQDR